MSISLQKISEYLRNERVVIVTYKPGLRLALRAGLCIAALVAVAIAYRVGSDSWASSLDPNDASISADERIAALEALVADGQRSAAEVVAERQFDAEALELVRQENKRLQDRIQELEEAIAFYRGVMDPGGEKGVKVHQWSLARHGSTALRYSMVLTQVARNLKRVSGHVVVTIAGRLDGDMVSYTLDELSINVESSKIPFGFRYFQQYAGELNLPEGFEAETVSVSAKARGRKAVKAEFKWKIEEVLNVE